eukprot:CAMPEP_0204343636 /NCGR_PEP_ID=MMETSP0469-20131031/25042_1 /ASSEMBLY_ACC=CAM_ASM_000384 /TAXON_ID=2969 /ORGANISM="Oxyrrhis marina" /LENGTH=86 /DNA_ID=CAMNT_0051328771 /DNA_START=40 /DNA_END=296 /DNA_ORIENTATION=+
MDILGPLQWCLEQVDEAARRQGFTGTSEENLFREGDLVGEAELPGFLVIPWWAVSARLSRPALLACSAAVTPGRLFRASLKQFQLL